MDVTSEQSLAENIIAMHDRIQDSSAYAGTGETMSPSELVDAYEDLADLAARLAKLVWEG